MTKDDTDIVSVLRRALVEQVGQQRYELWFGQGTRLDFDEGKLVIGVPSHFFKDWLRTNFREEIERAGALALGMRPEVLFRVECAESARVVSSADCAERPGSSKRADGADGSVKVVSADRPVSADRAPKRQFADFASFVCGSSNRLARAAAEMVVERPGELSPLVFYGPTSVGKTHLLEAIWTAARNRHPRSATLYLTAEQFTAGFLQALRRSGLPSFRQKYRGVDLLLLDDLQFFCGKHHTQIELLYTIDALMRDGRQLVFSADRSPDELADLGLNLCTRLQSGMVCRIEPPDGDMRRGILAEMARRMRMALPDDVRDFIAARLTNHARELSGALCRLYAASQALGRPIDLAMAEDILGEMIRHSSRVVRLADVENAVCRAFGLEPSSLHGDGKAKHVSQPRMLAMWLARKHTRAALSEIGRYFGRRSHSTVVSAQKRVDGWLARGATLELADRVWKVEEAVRQAERCLQVG